jgi:hypothetical protein
MTHHLQCARVESEGAKSQQGFKLLLPSFRDGPKDQTRNLEIPRCAIAHLRFDAIGPRERASAVAPE